MTLMIGAGAIDENPIFLLFHDEENSAMRRQIFPWPKPKRRSRIAEVR
jgi:hypothetical protein